MRRERTRILENFSPCIDPLLSGLGRYCEAIEQNKKLAGDKSQHTDHPSYRCVAMFSVKMLIRLEGAHVFYVSVFGGVEHFRADFRKARKWTPRRFNVVEVLLCLRWLPPIH